MADYREIHITPGDYLRYDGRQIQVILCAVDIDTGEDVVLCRADGYFTMTKRSFCQQVTHEGILMDKFTPLQHSVRHCRQSTDYYSYAKDLCEHFMEDFRKYKLCVDQKKLIDISRADYTAIREDLPFVKSCLQTTLNPYNAIFKGRFMEGLSIRKYAEATNMNRGSVEYLQKKLFTALAEQLEARDKADGISRLAVK